MSAEDAERIARGLCPACGFASTDGSTVCPRDGLALIPQLADPYIGTVLDNRYQIESVIGFGGITVVYKALDSRSNRAVVVKMLHAEAAEDQKKLGRFARGARAASILSHPNIIAVQDCLIADNGDCYLVMDYLAGTTLADLIGYRGPIGIERGIRIFTQVCDALIAAHEKKIVHRNLKPSNILIASTDGKDTVKIADFGIAKQLLSDDNVSQKITATGQWVGSPLYMSPEQAQGKAVDARSDIYSLGKVMLEAFKGRLPILAESMQESAHAPRTQAREHPEQVDVIPPAVQAVINRALQKDPKLRFQSARDLKKALASLLDSKGAGLKQGLPDEIIWRLKSHWRLTSTILALFIASISVFVWVNHTTTGRIEYLRLSLLASEIWTPASVDKRLSDTEMLAQLYMNQRQYSQAADAYSKAVTWVSAQHGVAAGKEIELLCNMSRALFLAGDNKGAEKAAKMAVSLAQKELARVARPRPLSPQAAAIAWQCLNPLSTLSAEFYEHLPEESFFLAIWTSDLLIETKRARQAVSFLRQSINRVAASKNSLTGQQNDGAESRALSRRLLWLQAQLMKAYVRDGQLDTAEEMLREYLSRDEIATDCYIRAAEVFVGLGDAYLSRGDRKIALSKYEMALRTYPDEGPATGKVLVLYAYAVALMANDQRQKAGLVINDALRLFGTQQDALGKLDLLALKVTNLVSENNLSQAEALQKELAELVAGGYRFDPAVRARCRLAEGDLYLAKKDFGRARQCYNDALKLGYLSGTTGQFERCGFLARLAACLSGAKADAEAEAVFKELMAMDESSRALMLSRLAIDSHAYEQFLQMRGRKQEAIARKKRTAEMLE